MVVARLPLGYLNQMRWLALLLAIVGCKTGSAPPGARYRRRDPRMALRTPTTTCTSRAMTRRSSQRALIGGARRRGGGRAAVCATLEDKGDYDQLRIAGADLAVRRRFIASLAACNATGQVCPPRLDDPPWTFDRRSRCRSEARHAAALRRRRAGRRSSAELHGRACACRTIACVDSMFVAIDRLEKRPMPEVQDEDIARTSIVRARDCSVPVARPARYAARGSEPTEPTRDRACSARSDCRTPRRSPASRRCALRGSARDDTRSRRASVRTAR